VNNLVSMRSTAAKRVVDDLQRRFNLASACVCSISVGTTLLPPRPYRATATHSARFRLQPEGTSLSGHRRFAVLEFD
jgi:hypothetical protein